MPTPFCVSKDEALDKVCWAKLGHPPSFANQDDKCVGPECMAWRFIETMISDDDGNLTVRSGDTHGYCGAAGQPFNK